MHFKVNLLIQLLRVSIAWEAVMNILSSMGEVLHRKAYTNMCMTRIASVSLCGDL